MSLREFDFIDEAVRILEDQRPELEIIEEELVKFFSTLPFIQSKLISFSSRVKSESSLKEKIIRNRYLAEYDDPFQLVSDIPDLIGIRIECKFIKEEEEIYSMIKDFFNQTDDMKFFYSKVNKNVRLYLYEKQPLKQKNGFEIYKIDGEYIFLNRRIKFELQIKSLVNFFWSEIEHKIIYKNNTFLLEDKFLKDMMVSIKNHLSMIDEQLMNIYNNFKPHTSNPMENSRYEIKKLFTKFLYDSITLKMQKEFYFVIDFKKPCETILNYSMYGYDDTLEDLSLFMTDEYKKISSFISRDIELKEEIDIDGELEFSDEFSKKLASFFINKMNVEVPWNLFFRILFELENEDWNETFMRFIRFYKKSLLTEDSIYNLMESFGEHSNKIIDDMYECIYKMIEQVGRVDVFYQSNIERIIKIASEGLEYVCYEFDTYYDYMEQKRIISRIMTDSLLKIF